MLDFRDEVLGERGVRLLGTGELAGLNARTEGHPLSDLSSEDLIKLSEENMPECFNRKHRPSLTGKLGVVTTREATGKKEILVAGVRLSRVLNAERTVLREALEEQAGCRLSLRTQVHRLKLAVLAPGLVLEPEALDQLASHLPVRITLAPGQLNPVVIQPLGELSGSQGTA